MILEGTSVSNAHLCKKKLQESTQAGIHRNACNGTLATVGLALHLPCWLQAISFLQMKRSLKLPWTQSVLLLPEAFVGSS